MVIIYPSISPPPPLSQIGRGGILKKKRYFPKILENFHQKTKKKKKVSEIFFSPKLEFRSEME